MAITPDLVEWLLADQKVCQSWRRLGVRMNLSCYIGYIQSQEKSNSASLRMLLRLWSSAKPECYNVKNLKRVLAAEGLHHMWLWISLMTQRQSPQLVSKKIKETNKTSSSSSPRTYSRSLSGNSSSTSPWSKYLYTGDTGQGGNGNTSDYFSSGEYCSDSSRSSSRLDHYNSGYTSCPTTPINNRKKFDFNFTSEHQPQMQLPVQTRASRDPLTRVAREQMLRSNSSGRITEPASSFSNQSSSRNHQHVRSSSLSRLPKLSKLTSPKIVETEVWKKEIYRKVTEEVRDYSFPKTPKMTRQTRSGSLPNLPNYVTSIDIQVVPSRTIKFKNKQDKTSEHEKEILKLCGDIITELKPTPLNINLDLDQAGECQSYSKINKVSIRHSEPQTNQKQDKQETGCNKKPADKFISVKNVQIEVEEPKPKPVEIKVTHKINNIKTFMEPSKKIINTIHDNDPVKEITSTTHANRIKTNGFDSEKYFDESADLRGSGSYFQSLIEEENRPKKFEIDDSASLVDNDSDTSSISDVETVKSYNSGTLPSYKSHRDVGKGGSSFDVSKSDLGGGYFENLVNILQEAVNDISR